MSWNHENVAWQGKDKTWSIGFFPATAHGSEDDGYDPEWDVDYDYDSFAYVSTGHKTVEDAQRTASKVYGNYGGSQILPWSKENVEYIAKYEQMALWHTNPEQAKLNQKKELAKLNREHVKQLKAQFAENKDYRGSRVTVTVKLDDNAYTRLGASRSYTGYLNQEGDWLVIDKVKVKNVKTGRFNRKLHEVKTVREPSFYGRGYY